MLASRLGSAPGRPGAQPVGNAFAVQPAPAHGRRAASRARRSGWRRAPIVARPPPGFSQRRAFVGDHRLIEPVERLADGDQVEMPSGRVERLGRADRPDDVADAARLRPAARATAIISGSRSSAHTSAKSPASASAMRPGPVARSSSRAPGLTPASCSSRRAAAAGRAGASGRRPRRSRRRRQA